MTSICQYKVEPKYSTTCATIFCKILLKNHLRRSRKELNFFERLFKQFSCVECVWEVVTTCDFLEVYFARSVRQIGSASGSIQQQACRLLWFHFFKTKSKRACKNYLFLTLFLTWLPWHRTENMCACIYFDDI